MLRWRSRCRAGDDGDHDGASEMEITSTRWWWPYHITYIDCMWCLSFYASYLALIDGSIIRWSLTKFQDKSVLPEYAPLPKFVVPRHHVMIGCDKLYVHLQRVQASFAPIVFERRAYHTDHHVVSQHEELLQRCILRENTFILKF